MNTVHLVGDIGDKFGHEWSMNVANYSELIKLIDCQTEGFKQYLLNAEEKGIGFVFQRAGEYINDESELLLSLNDEDIIMTAVPLGAGKKHGFFGSGIGKIIIGIIIVIIGYYLGPAGAGLSEAVAGQVMAMGGMMILQGVVQLLAPTSETEKKEEGYLLSGSANTVTQGQPVPLCYGELLVPGTPINVSYSNRPFNLGYLQYGDSPVDANGNIISGDLEGTSYEDVQILVSGGTLGSGSSTFDEQTEYYIQEFLR